MLCLAMIWPLICFLNLIQLTSSTFDFTPTILGGAKRAKFSESSSPADARNYESTAHQYANQPEHKMHHARPDLDQSHVTRIFESNTDGPYFWDSKPFVSKTDFWRTIDETKKQIDEVGIMRQVEIMRVKCLELRRNLESQQELNLIRYPDPNRNAYRTLEAFLERLSYTLKGLFYPENAENRNILMSYEPLQQTHWQALVSSIHETVGELQYTLLNFEGQNNYGQTGHFEKLIPQALRILNFLLKNSLIEEEILKDLIKQEKFKGLISSYIIKLMSYRRFLGLEFSESLLQSKSTEEVISVLKYFTEDELKLLEYKCLSSNIDYLVSSHGDKYQKFTAVLEAFSEAGFHLDDKQRSLDEYKIIRAKQILVLKDMVNEFIKSGRFTKLDIGYGPFEDQEWACGIFYDMLCFVIKYHPKLLEESCYKEDIFSIHLKWNLLDSELRYLRSAEVLEFFSSEGFWTTELSFSYSKHQISLNQVQGWVPTPKNELNYFKKGFRCYISRDFEIWKKSFQKASLDRSTRNQKSSECINPIHQNNDRPTPFGTNFNLPDEKNKLKSDKDSRWIKKPMISKLFLSDLYSWIEKYQFILENHKKNEKIWREMIRRLRSTSTEESIPWEIRSDLMHWLENSVMGKTVTKRLSNQFMTPQQTWNRIRGNMEKLNQIAKDSIGVRKYSGIMLDSIKSFKFDFQRKQALEIPNIDFHVDDFEIGEDFLLKESEV